MHPRSCSAAQQLSTQHQQVLLPIVTSASIRACRARTSIISKVDCHATSQQASSVHSRYPRSAGLLFRSHPLTTARACSKLSHNTRLLLLNCPQSRWPTRSTHPTTSTSSTPQEPQIRLPIHRPPRPPPRLLLPQLRATPMLLRPPLRSQTNTTMPKTARILTLPGLCSTSAASTLP